MDGMHHLDGKRILISFLFLGGLAACEHDTAAPASPTACSADDYGSNTAPSSNPASDTDDADDADLMAIGGTCGGRTCGVGTYCCNASCGTCVPKGMSCTQQSCN